MVGVLAGILAETVQRTTPVETSSARSSFDGVVTKRSDPSGATTGGAAASRGAKVGRGATVVGASVALGVTVAGVAVQVVAKSTSRTNEPVDTPRMRPLPYPPSP